MQTAWQRGGAAALAMARAGCGRDGGQRAAFAQVAKKRATPQGSAAAASLPQKQQFMRKRKEMLQTQDQAAPVASQKSILTDALFAVRRAAADAPGEEGRRAAPPAGLSGEEREERIQISKAYSSFMALRLHTQVASEHAFALSKQRAVAELRAASPYHAEVATTIDYALAPTHRRVATETPPDGEHFPFTMAVLPARRAAQEGAGGQAAAEERREEAGLAMCAE